MTLCDRFSDELLMACLKIRFKAMIYNPKIMPPATYLPTSFPMYRKRAIVPSSLVPSIQQHRGLLFQEGTRCELMIEVGASGSCWIL
jgi:hypothetical protein